MASDNPDEWWQHAPEGQQKKDTPSGQWQQGYQSQGGQPGVQWGQTAGQVPQPVPQSGAWEVPPLGSGGQGGPPRNNNATLIAVLAVVVVLVLAGVAGLVILRSGGSEENTAAAASTTTETTGATTTTATETTTSASAAPPVEGAPALKEGLSPVVLFGPTFEDSEDTYTMAFKDWPFAFRTPGSWGCLKGSIDTIPDAQAWGCIDEGDSSAGQRVNLMLRKCPVTCDAATRTGFDADWFDKEGAAEQFDPNTSYVETPTNDKGMYTIDLSRYVAAEPGGEPVWQVGVFVESPSATKDAVLKTLNDILTQTQ